MNSRKIATSPMSAALCLILTGIFWGAEQISVIAAQTDDAFSQGVSDDTMELLGIDQKIADAVVRGDTLLVERLTSDDFVMVHGDDWTEGNQPFLTDSKETMLARVSSQYYDVLDFDSVQVELHENVAITYGHYIAHVSGGSDPSRAWFSVWFERVYTKRDDVWIYLSHRTVNGPVFAAARESLINQ